MTPAPSEHRRLATTDIEAAASAWIARRDAGMTHGEVEEFRRWKANPKHARALARHENTWSFFERSSETGEGANLAREVRVRVARRRRVRMGAVLAVASALVVAGLVLRRSLRPTVPFASPIAATAVVLLPETRVLPDGSTVELKPGADLALEFTRHARRISLRRGEAHFQVTKDPDRLFVVAAAGVEVRAIGTAFAVEMDQAAVAVLVTEGRVAVDRTAGPARGRATSEVVVPEPAQPRTLGTVDAGNRLVVEIGSSAAAPTIVPISAQEAAERLGWRAPRLEFTGARLAEAVALINRHNKVQLEIDDPAIADLEVSGFFRSDNMAAFLHLLERGLGVTSHPRGDTVGLRKAEKPPDRDSDR